MFTSLLQRSARRYLTRHQPYVIGITGSIGKTTCRTILTQTLRQLTPDLKIESSEKNFNSETGLPLSVLGIHSRPANSFLKGFVLIKAVRKGIIGSQTYDLLIAEYGIDHPGDMQKLLDIWTPNIGILTGIDLVHAQGLLSPDVTVSEKIKLINQCTEIGLIHEGTLSTVSKKLTTDVDQLTFALHPSESEHADIWFHHWMLSQSDDGTLGSSFDVDEENDTITTVKTNLLSFADAGYISLGVQIAQILERRLSTRLILSEYEQITIQQQPGRFSIIPGQYGSVIIDSSYNAAPKSMKKTLDDVIRLRNQFYQDFDLIYVLGDMRELGEYSQKKHRELMAQVAQSADSVYLVGPEMSRYGHDELTKLGYNPQDITVGLDSRKLGKLLLEDLHTRDRRAVVVVKGSQNTIFTEEAIKPLLKDGQDPKTLLCRQDADRLTTKKKFYESLINTKHS